jgi:transposase
MDRIEVVTSVERRRRWSAAEKARLVAAMDEPGAVVTEIARSARIDASLLYRWRRQFAAERVAPTFVPVRIAEENQAAMTTSTCAPPLPESSALIAVSFGEHVRVTIEGAPDAATLASVIGALTSAVRSSPSRCSRSNRSRPGLLA